METTVRRAGPGDYEGLSRVFSDSSAQSGTLPMPMPPRGPWRKRLAEEGVQREYALRDGVLLDVLAMARIRHKGA